MSSVLLLIGVLGVLPLGCGSTTTVTRTKTVTVTATAETQGGATGDLSVQVRRWKETWCNLRLRMPRKVILSRMGEPNYVGSEDSDYWSGYGWSFDAEYNLQNRAHTLQWTGPGNQHLPCSEVR
jgi:hypothetical protein